MAFNGKYRVFCNNVFGQSLITYQKQIEIIALHPNSIHIIQPLDIAFFHLFKETWRKTVPKWKSATNILQLKRETFPKVLKMALDDMKDEKTIIINGFKAAGLMPFNSEAVDYNILQKRRKTKSNSIETNLTEKENQVLNNYLENEQQHIQTFEKNLPFEILQKFREALENGSWTGDTEQKALFEYWLKINKKSLGTFLADPHKFSIIYSLIFIFIFFCFYILYQFYLQSLIYFKSNLSIHDFFKSIE